MAVIRNPVTRTFDGSFSIIQRYGNASGGLNTGGSIDVVPTGTQRNIIVSRAIPLNPKNNSYMPVVNGSEYPSVAVKGMRTPSVSATCCMKPYNGTTGWANAVLFNSLMNTGGDRNTDAFAIRIGDDVTSRIWDWSRCQSIRMEADAVGGPVMVTLSFLSRFGDATAEGVYGLTFIESSFSPPAAAPTLSASAPDPGQLTYCADWDFQNAAGTAMTLSDVSSWSLTLFRAQRHRARAGVVVAGPGSNRVLYPADIDSGMFSGTFTVVQDQGANVKLQGAGTIVLNMNTSFSGANGGMRFTMTINDDNEVYPVETGFGTLTTTYSLINLPAGGNPCVIAALP